MVNGTSGSGLSNQVSTKPTVHKEDRLDVYWGRNLGMVTAQVTRVTSGGSVYVVRTEHGYQVTSIPRMVRWNEKEKRWEV